MGWYRFHNRTGAPVNIRASNAGITYHWKNQVEKYDEFLVAGIGWDITVEYSIGHNDFSPSDNWKPISAIAGLVAGTAVTVGGVALTIVTLGAAAPVAVAGVTISAGAITALGIASTAAGATLGAASIAIEAIEGITQPATERGFYGGNDFNFYIDGGLEGGPGPDGTVIISKVKPLVLSWINCQTGKQREAEGYAVPD